MQSKQMIEAGIGLVLFIYVLAAIVPGAVTSVVAVNSTMGYGFWGTSLLSLWGIIPIFIIIAILLMVYKFVK